MKKILIIILTLMIFTGLASCKRMTYNEFVKVMTVPFDAGSEVNGYYKNAEIGIDFPLPDSKDFTNEIKNYEDSLPNPPRGYKYAAQAILFESWYSEEIPYMRLTAFYQKYPDAKKYKTNTDYLKKFRDQAISYSVSQYQGDWKNKYILTDIQSTAAGELEYSYYTVNHVESNRYFYATMFAHEDYYFTLIIYGEGDYPEEAMISDIMAGIILYD